ncbi:MAG: DmsE family decaheme c-type cytochrome [Terriglobales bacterium]
MKDLLSRRRCLVWATAFALLSTFATTLAAASKHSGSDAQTPATAPVLSAPGAKYVGSDQCKICHADQARIMETTTHYRIFGADKQAGAEGCEVCHGPGSAHIDSAGDRSKISRLGEVKSGEVLGVCLNCHAERLNQMRFNRSQHASAGVTCVDCHRVHTSKARPLLVEKELDLCYGCHQETKSDFAKPFHHRVNEGLVQCNDCHNIHGTATVRQARTLPSGDAVCYKCHADKQGPFVYEHVPVKTEGCTTCHTPHGSTNPRLLKVSQVNMLCLQCHTFPTVGPAGPVHNQSAKYQACTMCHDQIHGSNFSSVFLK